MINPLKFLQGVKQEAFRVTWPGKKEVMLGSAMVFVLATIAAVFFLILDFISISCLFIMIGAEFLGMIMLIVYVGAVAVLFLFVVMMLNITEQITKRSTRKGIINNIIENEYRCKNFY